MEPLGVVKSGGGRADVWWCGGKRQNQKGAAAERVAMMGVSGL